MIQGYSVIWYRMSVHRTMRLRRLSLATTGFIVPSRFISLRTEPERWPFFFFFSFFLSFSLFFFAVVDVVDSRRECSSCLFGHAGGLVASSLDCLDHGIPKSTLLQAADRFDRGTTRRTDSILKD